MIHCFKPTFFKRNSQIFAPHNFASKEKEIALNKMCRLKGRADLRAAYVTPQMRDIYILA